MSVFESFPVCGGVARYLAGHLERLRRGCAETGLTMPAGALEGCAEALREAEDGFGRLYVTGGDGPVTGACDGCRAFLMVEEREPVPVRVYHRGYDLGMRAEPHGAVFPGLKTGNYWGNLRAFREGVAAQCNETLLFTVEGHLVSACMANVFVVHGGRLRTPGPKSGARTGVVREWVMRQVAVEEGLLMREDVEKAEEIFLTSSWLGVMPAASVAGRTLQRRFAPGLMDAYRKE